MEAVGKGLWPVQGGCTLSQPDVNYCIDLHAPITHRNRYVGLGVGVDGMGGVRESFDNNLEENFQSIRCMGRQAQALPQNLEAWCPGSLRTNPADPHRRAGSAGPTSAKVIWFNIGSRLDHPRSYSMNSIRAPTAQTGPPSRRKAEAASGTAKILRTMCDDCWFYFGSRAINII